jgi:hypothetical protein
MENVVATDALELTDEERACLAESGRCEWPNCRHLNALHDPESGLCMLSGCRCALDHVRR